MSFKKIIPPVVIPAKHIILETMVFPWRNGSWGGAVQHMECVGHRVSLDGGQTWIVRGNIDLPDIETIENRTRHVGIAERFYRIEAASCNEIKITVPGTVIQPPQPRAV